MGLGVHELYVTRLEKDDNGLYLSHYKPELRKDGRYYRPANTPLFLEMDIPDVLPDLKFEDGPKRVQIIDCEEETGLYMACYDDFFGGETHLFNTKPERKGRYYEGEESGWSIHIGWGLYGCKAHMNSYDPVRNIRLGIIGD